MISYIILENIKFKMVTQLYDIIYKIWNQLIQNFKFGKQPIETGTLQLKHMISYIRFENDKFELATQIYDIIYKIGN